MDRQLKDLLEKQADLTKQPFLQNEITERILEKTGGEGLYHKFEIDLSVAHTDAEYFFSGDRLTIEDVDDAVTIKLNSIKNSPIDLQKIPEIKGPIRRFYITNDAGSGTLKLLGGSRGMFEFKKKLEIINTANYIIYLDGTLTKAYNCKTGNIDSTNVDSGVVIRYAVAALTSGGHIHIRGPGTFIVDPTEDGYVAGWKDGCVVTTDHIKITGSKSANLQLKAGTTVGSNGCGFFRADGVADFEISGLSFNGNRTNVTADWIYAVFVGGDGQGGRFINNYTINMERVIWGDSANENPGWVIANNYFECQFQKTIALHNTMYFCLIKNNYFSQPQEAVFLDSMVGAIIEGNVIDHFTEYGIKMIDGVDDCFITGNFFYDTAGAGVRAAISIKNDGAASNRTIIKNNSFRSVYDGVNIEVNQVDTIIKNNVFSDIGNNAITDSSTTAVIRDNEGYVTENSGASGVIADGGTIAHGLNGTPTHAIAVGTVAGEIVNVTGLGAANLTIAIKTNAGAAGTNQVIYWRAWI